MPTCQQEVKGICTIAHKYGSISSWSTSAAGSCWFTQEAINSLVLQFRESFFSDLVPAQERIHSRQEPPAHLSKRFYLHYCRNTQIAKFWLHRWNLTSLNLRSIVHETPEPFNVKTYWWLMLLADICLCQISRMTLFYELGSSESSSSVSGGKEDIN